MVICIWQSILIEKNFIEMNETTDWNNTLRKVDVKPSRFDKIYMEKDAIEDKLYQIIDKFSENIEIHPFYNGNGRTWKILFTNDDDLSNLLVRQKIKKLTI